MNSLVSYATFFSGVFFFLSVSYFSLGFGSKTCNKTFPYKSPKDGDIAQTYTCATVLLNISSFKCPVFTLPAVSIALEMNYVTRKDVCAFVRP